MIPKDFEFAWVPPLYPHDPKKAVQLLTEAGYPNGFDAGEIYCDASYENLAEAVANDLKQVGIQLKLRPLERAAFFTQLKEKKLSHVIQIGSAAFGNAATRIDAFVAAGGLYTYGTYPDIEGLIQEQASGAGGKREAVLQKIQQLMYEKAMVAPIWELAFLNGVGSRVAESGLGLISGHAYSAPYEDLRLKGK
jgi:peptide/nickel transport system substrate-binding protein